MSVANYVLEKAILFFAVRYMVLAWAMAAFTTRFVHSVMWIFHVHGVWRPFVGIGLGLVAVRAVLSARIIALFGCCPEA